MSRKIKLSIILMFVSASLANGRTITVGKGVGYDYASIQAAINVAQEGDTVVVAEGYYEEQIIFLGNNIILTSTNPNDQSVVRGTEIYLDHRDVPVVTFTGRENKTCILSGFTISYGDTRRYFGHGGGILGNGTKATINKCIIEHNDAILGGGLYDCDGVIQNCLIHENDVRSNVTNNKGGGLYGCDGSIVNCIIGNNFAGDDETLGFGGGLYDCKAIIRDCIIKENVASGDGGGLCDCSGPITNCEINNNHAIGNGGGLYGCNDTISECTIRENRSDESGGGLAGCMGLIEDCTIGGNQAPYWHGGGAVNCNSFKNCLITGNTARGYGGGLYNCTEVLGCTITGNSTEIYPGGGLSECGTVANCVISNNNAGASGGGLHNCRVIANCTIMGNYAETNGGAASSVNESVTVLNSIIWDNQAGHGGQIFAECEGSGHPLWNLSVRYSNVQGGQAAAIVADGCVFHWKPTNIDADPLFVASDYHLRPGSPCIDAGDPDGDYQGQTDIDGDPRMIGSRVDIGADESVYVPPVLVGLEITGPAEVLEGESAQYTAMAYYDDNSAADVTNVTTWWIEPQGVGEINVDGLFAVGEIDEPIEVMINAKYAKADTIKQAQKVVMCVPLPEPEPNGIFYVDGINGSDDNDGLSRETAFKTIQRGINVAENGDVVLVYPDVYKEEIRFKGKAITVRSAEDAAIIENPDDFVVLFYYGEGPESVLKDFVIRNSMTGVFIARSSPTIKNLTVVGNDYGIECYGDDPSISNCILWSNHEMDLIGCEARYSWVQSDIVPFLGDGLIGYWSFDESNGNIAYDDTNGWDGIVHGANRTHGVFGGALELDGVDDYVQLPDNEPFWLPRGDISLSVWVWFYRNALDHEVILDLNGGSSGYSGNRVGYHIGRRESNTIGFYLVTGDGNLDDLLGSTLIQKGRWYHVVVVREGSRQAIYVDGQFDTEQICSNALVDFSGSYDDNAVNFGQYTTTVGQPRYHMKGKIDEVMIFGKALSEREIIQLYEGIRPADVASPLFVDPFSCDYHLRSERGRYWPEHDVWVLDDVTSPCIDGGDPENDYSAEREPNGGRINMGAYGGTAYASMSMEEPFSADVNGDGVIDIDDLLMLVQRWLDTSGWLDRY